jgi:hypothetical protein
MGASFCTIFESDVPSYGTLGSDHRDLLRHRDHLDRLAMQGGMTLLGAFESYAPEDTDGLLDEEMQEQLPPAEWFVAADGQVAVNALREYLAARPNSIPGQIGVMKDLSGIAEELAAAQGAGVRFRFAVIM